MTVIEVGTICDNLVICAYDSFNLDVGKNILVHSVLFKFFEIEIFK